MGGRASSRAATDIMKNEESSGECRDIPIRSSRQDGKIIAGITPFESPIAVGHGFVRFIKHPTAFNDRLNRHQLNDQYRKEQKIPAPFDPREKALSIL